ncbi:MAG: type II secretion system F family protein [Actinobacteria bacterium]|nr:MAG: type II secretion system F family protein [Actinomycetota bacterium]
MLIYLIVFSYYLFLCSGIFYLIKIKGHYQAGKIRNHPRRKKIVSGFVNKMNSISHKIGRLLIGKYWFEVKKENTELLKLLEFENKISLTLESLIGYKVILFGLFMIAGGLVGNNPANSGILSITGGAAGYFIPNLLLRSFRYRRQKEIDKDLPYVIDLLSVATLSGQNIYNAIKIVIEKYKGSICAELSNFIKDVDIGIGKFEAYRNLIDKSSSEDFKSFIFLLIQAERYGSSINEILKQKSKHMKFEAYQDIERKTRRITILTLFPLVFLILPSFIILVGGPLIFSIGGNILQF